MHRVNAVWIVAAAFAGAAIALVAFAFNFGWYGLIAGPPVFVAVSVLVSFFFVVVDQKKESMTPRGKPKRMRSRRLQPAAKDLVPRPAPAVAQATKASQAESAGRAPTVLSLLPRVKVGA